MAASPRALAAEPTVVLEPRRAPVDDYAAPTRIQPDFVELARAVDQRASRRPSPEATTRAPIAQRAAAPRDPVAELERVSPFGDEWAEAGLLAPEPSASPAPTPHRPRPLTRPSRARWLPWLIGVSGVAVGLGVGFVVMSPATPPASSETIAQGPDRASGPPALVVSRRAPAASATPTDPTHPTHPTDPNGAATPTTSTTPSAPAPSQVEAAPREVEAPTPPTPAPPKVPAWAREARDLNPWVEVPGARAEVRLGLPESMPRRVGREVRTGFSPALGVLAPRYDFRIQTHEVTWQELGLYIATREGEAPAPPAWALRAPEGVGRLPATNVSWRFARQYCQALGGDLPSEPEWAWAARGPELRTQPWGEALPDARLVRFRRGDPVPLAPIGTQTQDATPGPKPIRGLLGNASEWTRDPWTPSEPGVEAPSHNDSEVWIAVRGWPLGKPGSPLPAEGLTYRRPVCAEGPCVDHEPAALELVGFRCVQRI